MEGLFLSALTVLLFSSTVVAGFWITYAFIRITRGRDAAEKFRKEEW